MTGPTYDTERAELVAEVGECCRGTDPYCAAGCLVERALKKRKWGAHEDPPVCRLQFPDGSVPGNASEAAEGWHRRHGRAAAALRKLLSYNEDIARGRINYRPEDHIEVARDGLNPDFEPADVHGARLRSREGADPETPTGLHEGYGTESLKERA